MAVGGVVAAAVGVAVGGIVAAAVGAEVVAVDRSASLAWKMPWLASMGWASSSPPAAPRASSSSDGSRILDAAR